ncbi:MAG: hypothetical protein JZU55_20140 [Afipia sp.]|nr:hypothetical protein [Afipia sp.]
MSDATPTIMTFGPPDEADRRLSLAQHIRNSPIPDKELLHNLGLYLTPQTLSRILFMDFLYQKIIDVQGIVAEFGCRWGQNLSLFLALRGIYEPFNRLRHVVGFDTLEGFPDVRPEDGAQVAQGDYATAPGYEGHLRSVLALQEQESPLNHLTKHSLVVGDATRTVPQYLKDNPQTIIALAYFDFDIFQPTHDCLKHIEPYLTRGSVIGFDEVNDPSTPGETVALREVFGLGRYAIRRYRYNSRTSYLVVE